MTYREGYKSMVFLVLAIILVSLSIIFHILAITKDNDIFRDLTTNSAITSVILTIVSAFTLVN